MLDTLLQLFFWCFVVAPNVTCGRGIKSKNLKTIDHRKNFTCMQVDRRFFINLNVTFNRDVLEVPSLLTNVIMNK